MRPPLRWIGGKYRLRATLSRLADQVNFDRLVDPFFGGGSSATIFSAGEFIANDSNEDLMNFHSQCALDPDALYDATWNLVDDRDTYLAVRSRSFSTEFERAVCFLYLNRTAYGGIYRVNRNGDFNVPYGGGGRLHVARLKEALIHHGRLMNRGSLQHGDYSGAMENAGRGDLLFVDPPYAAPGADTFNRYSVFPYSSSTHEPLAVSMIRRFEDGARVIATFPASEAVLQNFAEWRVVKLTVEPRIPMGEVVIADPKFELGVRMGENGLARILPGFDALDGDQR